MDTKSKNDTRKQVSDNNAFKKKFTICFWSIITAGLVAIVCIFWMITKGWLGYLPPLDELQNPKNKFATEVISADMQLLGRYYRNENRVSVDFTDISPNMINALIATEDVRFYDHTGVDAKSLFRAIIKLGKAGGGSTLTQQLAKLLLKSTTFLQVSVKLPVISQGPLKRLSFALRRLQVI